MGTSMFGDLARRPRSGRPDTPATPGRQTAKLSGLAADLNASPAVQRLHALSGALAQRPRNGIAPVQRLKSHATKVIADRELGIAATYDAITAYVKDDDNSVESCRALLAAWNKNRSPRQMYWISPPSRLAYPKVSEKSVADFSNWDSDDDMGMDIETEPEKRKTGDITITRGDGRDIKKVPLLSMSDAIRLGRQVVRKDAYHKLPFATQIGGQTIEYNHPGTKDIYATPLEKTTKDGKDFYKRQGTSSDFNFKNLANNLSAELEDSSDSESEAKESKESPSKTSSSMKSRLLGPIKKISKLTRRKDRAERRSQRALKNIFGYFEGKKPKKGLSKAQAEAISAIGSDFMKGHAAIEFIKSAKKNMAGSSFLTMFTGTSPTYKPAAVKGRGLVVKRTTEEREAATLAVPR